MANTRALKATAMRETAQHSIAPKYNIQVSRRLEINSPKPNKPFQLIDVSIPTRKGKHRIGVTG